MTWNYTNRPEEVDRDKVRFLSGDVDASDPLVTDEEIAYSLSKYPEVELAAAFVLRALAARFSRKASMSAGGISSSCSDIARAFSERAKELDPDGETVGAETLCEVSFGGLTISEHVTYDSDTDAVQPSFKRGQDDIPDGPGDNSDIYDPRLR